MARPTSKASWLLMVGVSLGLCALFLLVLPDREEVCRVKIGFAGYTERDGRRFAVFVATNTHARPLYYSEILEQKSASGWPVYPGVLPHKGRYDVATAKDFFILSDIPEGGEPWRVSICYYIEESAWSRLRWRAAEPLYDKGWSKAGSLFHKGYYGFIVTGPEMEGHK